MILTTYARSLRKNLTEAESQLWKLLRRKQFLGFRFRRQAPVGPYIADFLCYEKRLVIELDGSHHLEHQFYDQQRTLFLRDEGFDVLRFWNHQVFLETECVIQMIALRLGVHPLPYLPPLGGRNL